MINRLVITLILFCFYFSAAAQAKADFGYQLSYKGNRVQVALLYHPLEKDSTLFTYGEPMFGGQMDITKCIGDVTVIPPARLVTDRANRRFKLDYTGK